MLLDDLDRPFYRHTPYQHLHDWLKALPADLQLYAVLSGTSDAQPVALYEREDGEQYLHPLYTQEAYHNWRQVMPYLVPLSRTSPFLDWVARTETQDWGWLCSSPLPSRELISHLAGLTQALTEEGKAVFFRYWDGHFFRMILRLLQHDGHFLLPPVAQYWINSTVFTFQPDRYRRPRPSPWWTIPAAVMRGLEQEDPGPVVSNMIKYLQEQQTRLYYSVPLPVLEAKVNSFYSQWRLHHGYDDGERLLNGLCQYLYEDMQI